MNRVIYSSGLGVLLAIAGAVFVLRPGVEAIAPCVPHTNTAEEWAMLDLVQDYRDGAVASSAELTLSGPLNAAAMGYAQYVASHPGTGGHQADGSQPWLRAENCGFVTRPGRSGATGGEGIAIALSGGMSGSAAVLQMSQEALGGIHTPGQFLSYQTHCTGIAKATGSGGRTVWVVLLFAREGACPDAQTAPLPPTATATATQSPPTVTPAEPVYRAFAPGVATED